MFTRRNEIDSKNKLSLRKICVALCDDIKATDWMIELRYFIKVAIIPTFLITSSLFIFDYEEPFTIGFLVGSFLWLMYTSYGTTHESRKMKINDIVWCLDPYMFDNPPSPSRQNLSLKHNLNIKEFTVLSMIQRLHLIFGMLFTVIMIDVIIQGIRYPHLDEMELIWYYILGAIIVFYFYTSGVHQDIKLHFICVVPTFNKLLWRYTIYVFLFLLINVTLLYLSTFYIIRLII